MSLLKLQLPVLAFLEHVHPVTDAIVSSQGFFNSVRAELYEYPEILISLVCPGPVQSMIVQNAFTEELNKVMDLDFYYLIFQFFKSLYLVFI